MVPSHPVRAQQRVASGLVHGARGRRQEVPVLDPWEHAVLVQAEDMCNGREDARRCVGASVRGSTRQQVRAAC